MIWKRCEIVTQKRQKPKCTNIIMTFISMSAFSKDQKKTLGKCFLKVIWKVWFVHEYFKLTSILALILLHISSNIRIFKTILTSLPTRSFLFSITPHGAIPIVQIFRDDLEACSLRASPTCLATPVHTKFNSLYLKIFTVLIKKNPVLNL